ncbi:hypothetical protein E2C01_011952 [Portunus trituberculatus]|uniref:Uncharacterized protein n=1 Tax=Portunus trituberculatus TaxID=210409 RepID=A0A5B7DD79_PORTR|nr:hypothetical protein [Portunus trituberculatus]
MVLDGSCVDNGQQRRRLSTAALKDARRWNLTSVSPLSVQASQLHPHQPTTNGKCGVTLANTFRVSSLPATFTTLSHHKPCRNIDHTASPQTRDIHHSASPQTRDIHHTASPPDHKISTHLITGSCVKVDSLTRRVI